VVLVTIAQWAAYEHLERTKNHVERLEQVFEKHEVSPKGKKCLGMQGLMNERKEVLSEDMEENILDAAIIAAAQRVEHYEMAEYGTARTFAKMRVGSLLCFFYRSGTGNCEVANREISNSVAAAETAFPSGRSAGDTSGDAAASATHRARRARNARVA
jgi:hypothetical protein